MPKDTKYTYKKTIRLSKGIKSIIDRTFREVCQKTGRKFSYGRIARAFWYSLAHEPVLRKKCVNLVCKNMLKDADKNPINHIQ